MTPENISSSSAQPSASGTSTSHRNTGTPARRIMLTRFGTVQTPSVRVGSSSTVACIFRGLVGGRRRAGRRHPRHVPPYPPHRQSQDSSRWAASRISPTSSSMTSSSVDQPEEAALVVADATEVGTPALEDLQGVVQRVAGAHRREGADPALLDDPLPTFLVGLEDVLDVEVAHQAALVAPDREPAEAGGGTHVLDLRDGGVSGHRGQLVGRHQDGGDGALGEAQRPGEPVVLVLTQQALTAGLLDEGGDLLAGIGGAHLVHQLHPRQPEDPRRHGVDDPDHRAQHGDEGPHRRPQHQGRAVGAGEGDVLGDHLAQHHVQVDHDREPDRERDGVQQPLGHLRGVQHRLDEVGDGRLRDRTQQQ